MMKNLYRGKFIIFEGIDGSGKTTQAGFLEEKMKQEGYSVLRTKEPRDDNPFGGLVRAIYMKDPAKLNEFLPQMLKAFLQNKEYKDGLSSATKSQLKHYKIFEMEAREIMAQDFGRLPLLIQLGMIFDRFYHLKHEIIPALKQGKYVISDRYFISTLAYGAGENLDWKRLLKDHFDILGNYFILPDCVFFLDLPLELGLERTNKKQAGKKEYFDIQAKIKKIQNAYYEIFDGKEIKGKTEVIKINGSCEDPKAIHREIWKHFVRIFKTKI